MKKSKLFNITELQQIKYFNILHSVYALALTMAINTYRKAIPVTGRGDP
jgi:hypothetical protein